jgi:cysteine desulfurase
MRIYLDNAATTPLDKDVIQTMLPYMENMHGNPSSIHHFGRETRAAIEKARKTVARLLGAQPGEIFFTSGGTESNNTAITCAVAAQGTKTIITSTIEHHCVLHTVEWLEQKGMHVERVRVDKQGHFDLRHLEQLLQTVEGPVLVSLMHANNEIGTLQDMERMGELCKQYNAWFHSDTVQTVAHYQFDLKNTPVHFISGAAHKFHGPKGIGFLYINHAVKIDPFIHGGAQERNMRAGTENVYGIVGLAKAMELAYEQLEERNVYIGGLRHYFLGRLQQMFDDVQVNGDPVDGLYTVLNISFPLTDQTSMLLFHLDVAGIAASSGSACSSGSDKNSHVLEAIGMDPNRVAIRFSFSHFNTREELDETLEKLKQWVPVAAGV